MRTVERQPRPQPDAPVRPGDRSPDKTAPKTPEGWEAHEWRERYRDQRRRWRLQRERAERARQQKRLGLDDGLTTLAAALLAHPHIPDDLKRELAGRSTDTGSCFGSSLPKRKAPDCHPESASADEESSTALPVCHPERLPRAGSSTVGQERVSCPGSSESRGVATKDQEKAT